jgi:AbrB family looped-hinge helix DNA binding protein
MVAVDIKLRKNGQITIPLVLRQALNLKVGDMLDIKVRNGKLILTPVKK